MIVYVRNIFKNIFITETKKLSYITSNNIIERKRKRERDQKKFLQSYLVKTLNVNCSAIQSWIEKLLIPHRLYEIKA